MVKLMAQYIDKSTLVAEIKKIKSYIGSDKYLSDFEKGCNFGREDVCDSLLNFIDTLEVKEVDLEKEIQQHINDCLDIKFPTTDVKMIAKDVEYTARKFFELGLKTQKGE
jgi:hypothetical protein